MKKQIKPILRFALGEVYTFLGVFSTLLTIICLIDFSELVPDFAGRIVCVVIVFAVSYGMAVIRVASTKRTVVDLENGPGGGPGVWRFIYKWRPDCNPCE